MLFFMVHQTAPAGAHWELALQLLTLCRPDAVTVAAAQSGLLQAGQWRKALWLLDPWNEKIARGFGRLLLCYILKNITRHYCRCLLVGKKDYEAETWSHIGMVGLTIELQQSGGLDISKTWGFGTDTMWFSPNIWNRFTSSKFPWIKPA